MISKTKLGQKDASELIKAVQLYLIAQAAHETKEDQVNAVYREVLEKIELWNDLDLRLADSEKTRITEVKDMYLSEDEEACKEVYKIAASCMRQRGIIEKEDWNKEDGWCPEYPFFQVMQEAEKNLVQVAADFTEQPDLPEKLEWQYKNRQRFIEINIKFAVNHPDWEDPLKILEVE